MRVRIPLPSTLPAVMIIGSLMVSGCTGLKTIFYSNLKLDGVGRAGQFPTRETMEGVLSEIWRSGFLVHDSRIEAEITDNTFGIIRKTWDETQYAFDRACFISDRKKGDQILFDRNLFARIQWSPKGVVYLGLDRNFDSTLVHELFHDFWYNIVDYQQRYRFSADSESFFRDLERAAASPDHLPFLRSQGFESPVPEDFLGYRFLLLMRDKYPDAKFFGTELFSIIAQRAYSKRILIPPSLQIYYQGIVADSVLKRKALN